MTINQRESYDIFGCSGILFNHESPLRGREFVTRKITDSVAKIKLGKLECMELGNLDAKRDWGFAKEYVKGMWRMLQVGTPDTYVFATNRTETVRDFVEMAFKWSSRVISSQKQPYTFPQAKQSCGSTRIYRPAEIELLSGDPAHAKAKLGWELKTTLEQLCQIMVEADLRRN